MRNVVDSSAWLEYFANGPNARYFAPAIQDTDQLIVPTLALFEVLKRVLQQADEGAALQAVASMQQGAVVDLTPALALTAARISLEHRLPMADSVMLATARAGNATLWTMDADFKGLTDVKYRKRKP